MRATTEEKMVLKGALSLFHLVDLLQFIGMSQRTGELAIQRPGHEQKALIYFESGKIIHATDQGSRGIPALDRILTQEDGQFNFRADVLPEQRTIDLPLQFILLESQRRKDEMDELQRELPANGQILFLNPLAQPDAPLETDFWPILALINGRRTLQRICEIAGHELETKKKLRKLFMSKLIGTEPPLHQWHHLKPVPVSSAEFSAERPFPPRFSTNLLLKSIDGQQDLITLQRKHNLKVHEFLEAIRLLVDSNWIRFLGQEVEEYQALRDDY